jgi:hypothetical protein
MIAAQIVVLYVGLGIVIAANALEPWGAISTSRFQSAGVKLRPLPLLHAAAACCNRAVA